MSAPATDTYALLAALEARGAVRLPHDPVRSLPAPHGLLWHEADEEPTPLGAIHDGDGSAAARMDGVTLFRAAGITEELREVLRRVVARGIRWDEVEIVTPDPGVYGPAVHALAARLDIPVTFAVGLPVERTRAGRALAAWLRWVREGFPEPVLRRLLESGDLAPPPPFLELDGATLARRLRRLSIGWGRKRYVSGIEAARRRLLAAGPRRRRSEGSEEAAARHRRELRELDALLALIAPIERAVPPVPERIDAAPVPVAPGALGAALAVFLERVPEGGSVDQTALERLRRILDRVAATLDRPTTFSAALATLSEHLAIRVPAPRAEGRAPWGSHGGHLHLADVEHGGWTRRPVTFVVGLDAARFPGVGSQDPILLDGERAALTGSDLPTSADRLDERRFRMAALLARLRGSVTLSYAAWEPLEGRTLTPSPLLLQLYRRVAELPTAGFQDLDRFLGDPLSRIPRGGARLDTEDVWLSALRGDGRLLDGEAAVRASFGGLAAGLYARAARTGDRAGPHHGVVRPRPVLNLRSDHRNVLSSRRLEALGTCPLRYFYGYVLGIAPADDPTFDPECWLDPLRRGALLHAVYDRVLRRSQREGISPRDERFPAMALEVLAEEAEAMRLDAPPPSRVVYEYEMEELADEVRSFVAMVRDDLPSWEATELRFGFDDAEHPPVELPLPSGGAIRVRGAIDRVDLLPSGGLRVVDYKTGSPGRYSTTTVWDRGRRLQHLLYTEVAERLLGRPVERMEYHFPTRKGENRRSPFTRAELRDGLALLDRLLDVVAAGHFVPTQHSADCRWCDFREICRVEDRGYGRTGSSLAEWAEAHLHDEAYAEIQLVRLFHDRGGRRG